MERRDGVLAACLCAALGSAGLSARQSASATAGHPAGFATIAEDDLYAHVAFLAAPELEGRDTPSAGLRRSAQYIGEKFEEWGLEDFPEHTADFRWVYQQEQAFDGPLAIPLPEQCALSVRAAGAAETTALAYGVDFVPVPGGGGKATGEPVFLGFGIDSKQEPYNDLKGTSWQGKVAVILESEPRHKRLFEGDVITDEADLYAKIEMLAERGAIGVLAVRRPPPVAKSKAKAGVAELARPPVLPLSFRHSWAHFVGHEPPVVKSFAIPALEITPAAAQKIVGQDVLELASSIDAKGKPVRVDLPGVEVSLASATSTGAVDTENVVGWLRGSDSALAAEYVVIGAHYDHLGVDPRGRIGVGADDNASGTAAVMEIMQALASARPRRSVIAVLFAGEEDGLFGSKAFCGNPPVPREQMVAMVNIDMLGRGKKDEVLLLGLDRNPALEEVVDRAQDLAVTRLKKVVTNRGQDLFERSDHYSFHQIGVPSLFFYEGWPESENEDYHTYNDVIEELDFDKITRSVRLVYNLIWLLANDDARPPAPR